MAAANPTLAAEQHRRLRALPPSPLQAASERNEIEREMNRMLFERSKASQEAVLKTLTDEMARWVGRCAALQPAAGLKPQRKHNSSAKHQLPCAAAGSTSASAFLPTPACWMLERS